MPIGSPLPSLHAELHFGGHTQQPNGEFAKEKAELRALHFGQSNYETGARIASCLRLHVVSVPEGVVCAPRMNTSTLYYQLTKVNASDFSVADELVLPQRMTPCNLGYGKSGFVFALDNIYNYGDEVLESCVRFTRGEM